MAEQVERHDAVALLGEVLGEWAVAGTPVRNPAFDVTPAELVWALVTEEGVRSVDRT